MHLMGSGLVAGTLIGLVLMSWSEVRAQPMVYVVNYPLAYFAERIGGGQIEAVFPASDDGGPRLAS